ncbi:MAG: T9SS type A sorting domain-containing protein [bacterium]|nr:T9SS type A sorting domain-containing protein [bacterium]
MHFHYRLPFALIASLLLFCCLVTAHAGDEVRAPFETTGAPGQVVRVIVMGTLSEVGITRITLEYPHQIVSIRAVIGSGIWALRCVPVAIVENVQIDAERSRLVVECGDIMLMTNGPLFGVDVQFLPGPEAIGSLSPTLIRRNNIDLTDGVYIAGAIRRTAGGVIQDPNAEGITSVYPNPVISAARVAYVLGAAGIAHMQVRDSRGRLVQVLKDVPSTAGQNVVDLGLIMTDLSSGSYILQLTTDVGSYLYPFVVQK